MEPHREDQPKLPGPGGEQKPKRFRIVKLEERIAPSAGGGTRNCNNQTQHGNSCFCFHTYSCRCGG